MDNMASSGTENSQDSVSLRQEDTVSLVKSIMSSEFRDLKKQLIEKPSNSLKRKIVDDKSVSFKYNGNQKQYDFNCSVVQNLRNIKCILEDSTLEDIDKVLSDVQGRNKLIKIADRTEGGWTTVDEYEKSDYADNSEDDKKIRQANTRALQKKRRLQHRASSLAISSDSKRGHLFRERDRTAGQFDICFRCGLEAISHATVGPNSQWNVSGSVSPPVHPVPTVDSLGHRRGTYHADRRCKKNRKLKLSTLSWHLILHVLRTQS